jgi:hypothetical protein
MNGCEKSVKNDIKNVAPKAPDKSINPEKADKPAITPAIRIFTTASFSDKSWINGILIQKKSKMFIMLTPNQANPVRIGYKLRFAAAGEVEVKEVGRLNSPTYSTLFVDVNKDLDPIKDGTPNPVVILGFKITPCLYSDSKMWKNGVHLKTRGTFFFLYDKKDTCPIQIGDRLIFKKAGETIVKDMGYLEASGANSSIMITVDKPLDPLLDGAPNEIQVVLSELK